MSLAAAPAEIAYRLPWRTDNVMIGGHRSRAHGGIGTFRETVPFSRRPDPQRIDLRQSLRDPFGTLHVRLYEQPAAVTVYVLVDLSASMSFRGATAKLPVAAELAGGLAVFAGKVGDRFGLIGCDGDVRPDCLLPATRRRGLADEVRRLVVAPRTLGRSAEGLAKATPYLVGRRKLVFLISDFRMTLGQLERILASLAPNDVVPVMIEDSVEDIRLPTWGLVGLADLESGHRRLVFMRPALRRAWQHKVAERKRRLDALFARYGRAPIVIRDRLDPERVIERLLAG
ncbi:DUF58 domain-containing protein [Marinivivus vitaminiproducens]|uniref:DUF58 domain-containing protein n=1 Tax=Marinivivus vitaminiproducens TaxID=3035935 RepID=UPI0027A01C4D|nr:DUF58 domain-containing protein [Geminicoccaceae bacterium SCSIO 64248]